MKQNYQLLLIIICIVGILLISGCIRQAPVPEHGFLQGKVTIGPLCPVERNPPDPNCLPTAETYASWPIAIRTSDKGSIVAHIEPNLDGNYSTELPTGEYIVDLENRQQGAIGWSNLPAPISINSKETSFLYITIDTGIR